MTSHTQPSARLTLGTGLLAAVHVAMAVLVWGHVAAPTRPLDADIPPKLRVVAELADDQWWIPAHLALATLLAVGWWRGCHRVSVTACTASGAALIWWGTLCLAWATSTTPPSAQTGGVLAGAAGLGALILAQGWAVLGVDD